MDPRIRQHHYRRMIQADHTPDTELRAPPQFLLRLSEYQRPDHERVLQRLPRECRVRPGVDALDRCAVEARRVIETRRHAVEAADVGFEALEREVVERARVGKAVAGSLQLVRGNVADGGGVSICGAT